MLGLVKRAGRAPGAAKPADSRSEQPAGREKRGERHACSCPEGKHKSSELQCSAMLVPSAPTASRAVSQIFTYVIVPLSSIVAKETQILLLTCGELLMY